MDGSRALFNAVLKQLPNTIQKLVFTVSIDGNGTMGEISGFEVTIRQNDCEPIVLQLAGTDFSQEKAIISFELYQKNGWRYNAVARGFNGGLGDLLRAYGGEEEQSSSPSANQKSAPPPSKPPISPVVQSVAPPVQPVQQKPVQPVQQQASYVQPVAQQQTSPVQPVYQQQPVQQQTPKVQPVYQQPPMQQQTSPVQSVYQQQQPAQPQKKVELLKLGNQPVNLKKNDKVELRKSNDEVLKKVVVGLGWDAVKVGMSIDCDFSVFLCQNGKLRSNSDIVAFYQLKHSFSNRMSLRRI